MARMAAPDKSKAETFESFTEESVSTKSTAVRAPVEMMLK